MLRWLRQARSSEEARKVPIRTVGETGSTNDDLLALAAEEGEDGQWLRAETQTGGRGRLGRSWQSPPGNLHASTLVRLRPGDPPPASLALVAAVALHETVAAYSGECDIRIKWPNDLVCDGAKLAGILLERSGSVVVIGFGVNLAAHPDDLPAATTSLKELIGDAPDPHAFNEELAGIFAAWLAQWRSGGLGPILEQWQDAAHPPGTPLSVALGQEARLQGRFEGLDRDGALRLRLADGAIHVIRAGDVFLA
jgi:BirA family biotin operon repressor/biotin-[acetyl-CoA-carboxylase] ligase